MFDKTDNRIIELQKPVIYNFDKGMIVSTQLKRKRMSIYYDVVLSNNGKEIFIGHYSNEYDNIKVSLNNGNLLIYSLKSNKKGENSVKVLDLYNIEDDLHYSVTEKEALDIFDSSLKVSNLKDGDNNIHRTDLEKIKRLKFKRTI